ncbi:hypothetical protein QFC24_005938 [Naganishia onofrii]|uniref:Uncharacterized protein n=1 Tax=Naganishia onofrii TaxID=1851511 RepID=A0ACC2X4Y5_9TREE|nr:hypothetical protein QFC24_005938 [Naganishia onofrii]
MEELGRGTSPAEGLGICQAIAEEFIRKKSFVLFTTHFLELAETIGPFPGTEILHLHSHIKSRPQGTAYNTEHSYRVVQGAVKLEHYGLELAKLADLPETVLEKSTEIAYKLEARQTQARAASESQAIAARRKALINVSPSIALSHRHLDKLGHGA